MAAVAKQTAMVGGAAGSLSVPDLPLPTSQLTPNFFDSIFNDGMNPFDECFGGSTPGGSSLLASTLRKENSIYTSTPSDRSKVLLKDETLPAINTRVDRALTPEQSPKTLSSSAQASLPTQLSLSRSPSPFTFSIQTTFPQSPVSSITPITSPEDMTPTDPAIKEQVTPPMPAQTQKVTRKSFSALKTNNATPIHKRNQSLPQNWNLGNQFIPELPDGKSTLPLRKAQNARPKGVECVPKPALRSKTRFSDTPLPQLVSRMDGIFVTENIPLSEVKAEPDSPNAATFHSINSSAGRKRKKSSVTVFDDDEDEDEDDSKLNETEKRARFLERNRIAASKCRKKKKLMNQRLEDKSRLLVQQNRFLSATLAKLRSDVLRLKQMVLTHHGCGHAPIEQYLHNEAGKYLAAESEDNAKKLKKDDKVPKPPDLDGILRAEDVKLPAWLNEFHSFQEVESEALKRSGNILDFDDDDFQKLLLGDQITMLDDEFGTSPPMYE